MSSQYNLVLAYFSSHDTIYYVHIHLKITQFETHSLTKNVFGSHIVFFPSVKVPGVNAINTN